MYLTLSIVNDQIGRLRIEGRSPVEATMNVNKAVVRVRDTDGTGIRQRAEAEMDADEAVVYPDPSSGEAKWQAQADTERA